MKKFRCFLVLGMMLSMVGFASCSSDDDVSINQLQGVWRETYAPGVIAEGSVSYAFTPQSERAGTCDIQVANYLQGRDTTYHRIYFYDNSTRRLTIQEMMYGGSPKKEEYIIEKLDRKNMVWAVATGKEGRLTFSKEQ